MDTRQWDTIAQVIDPTLQRLPATAHASVLLKMGAMSRKCHSSQIHYAITVFERARTPKANPKQRAVIHARLSE